jgi:hypothetical protein
MCDESGKRAAAPRRIGPASLGCCVWAWHPRASLLSCLWPRRCGFDANGHSVCRRETLAEAAEAVQAAPGHPGPLLLWANQRWHHLPWMGHFRRAMRPSAVGIVGCATWLKAAARAFLTRYSGCSVGLGLYWASACAVNCIVCTWFFLDAPAPGGWGHAQEQAAGWIGPLAATV